MVTITKNFDFVDRCDCNEPQIELNPITKELVCGRCGMVVSSVTFQPMRDVMEHYEVLHGNCFKVSQGFYAIEKKIMGLPYDFYIKDKIQRLFAKLKQYNDFFFSGVTAVVASIIILRTNSLPFTIAFLKKHFELKVKDRTILSKVYSAKKIGEYNHKTENPSKFISRFVDSKCITIFDKFLLKEKLIRGLKLCSHLVVNVNPVSLLGALLVEYCLVQPYEVRNAAILEFNRNIRQNMKIRNIVKKILLGNKELDW